MKSDQTTSSRKPSVKNMAFLLVLLGLAGVVTSRALAGPQYVPNSKDAQKSDREVKPKEGADERAAPMAGADYIAGNGIVEPADRETKVSSHVPGRIAHVFVKEGDFVEAGVPLAEVENLAEKAALVAAEGDLTTARAELTRTLRGLRKEDVEAIVADTESVKARAALSQTTLERVESLAKTGASTPDELDRARRQAESDRMAASAADARRKAAVTGSRAEDVLVAQAHVQAAVGRRDQAQASLDRLTVRAPIAGQVLQIKIRPGEYYNPQAAEPIIILGDTRKLRVRMDVDERDIAYLSVGSKAFATLSAFGEKRFEGKVVEIGKRMGRKNVRTDDPVERIDTKILEAVIELDAPQGLVPGLRVTSYVSKGRP